MFELDNRFDCTFCPYRISCIDDEYSVGCRYHEESVKKALRKKRLNFFYDWKHHESNAWKKKSHRQL